MKIALRVDVIESGLFNDWYYALVDEQGHPVLRLEPDADDEHGVDSLEYLGLQTGDRISLEVERV